MRMFATKTRMRNAAIKEYKCVIRIGAESDESSRTSHHLSDKLREKHGDDRPLPLRCNYTEHYIRQQIGDCLKDCKPLRSYVADYEERSGSLTITFSVLVISSVGNYGEIHETIDLQLERITLLFQSLLGYDHPVRHSLLQSRMVMIENMLVWPELHRNMAPVWLVLFLVFALGLLSWLGVQSRGEESRVREIVKKEIERHHVRGEGQIQATPPASRTEFNTGAGR